MTAGIYEIIHPPSGRRYIGSSKEIEYRWVEHRDQLEKGRHDNEYLQRAWTKYGPSEFEWQVVEECSVDQLMVREQYYIDLYWSIDLLFNLARSANSGWRGRPRTEAAKRHHKATVEARSPERDREIRQKRSAVMKRVWAERSEEEKQSRSQKISETGKKTWQDRPEEWRHQRSEKISTALVAYHQKRRERESRQDDHVHDPTNGQEGNSSG